MSAVCIYTLSHPISNEIRYVGKTWQHLEKRLSDHIYSARKSKDHRSNWINSLVKSGLQPKIEELASCNMEDWQEEEKYWIKILKFLGCNLVNQNVGGLGNNGHKLNSESRMKISKSLTGLKQSAETVSKRASKLLGRKQTKEHIEKSRQSRLQLQRKLSDDHKAILSKLHKDKKLSSDHKQKLLKASQKYNKLKSKKVDQFTADGIFIQTFDSQLGASKATGTNFSSLRLCLKNKRKKANGFIWKYHYNTDTNNKSL
jgi:group I intron endonuclease